MQKSTILRPIFFCATLFVTSLAAAQPRAAACFYAVDFETPDALTGWDTGAAVEVQSPTGDPLGEFVDAWRVGTAQEANSAGYFPVPDQPVGNRSVMANDAAPPCNCAMDAVSLTSPAFDLSSRNNVVLEFRSFNSGAFGSAPAVVQASGADNNWQDLQTLPVLANNWQMHTIDLGAFDGDPSVRIRFVWSDGGTWSSGFAVDDICLRERAVSDLTVLRVLPHDAGLSPFTLGDQSLRYRQLPLEQAGPLTVSVEVRNTGSTMLRNITANALVEQNGSTFGPFTGAMLDSLQPGGSALVRVATGWQANAAGMVGISATATADGTEDDPSDNSGQYQLQITGQGWENDYYAMACDDGTDQAHVGSTESFLVANRMEIITAGSRAYGISMHMAPGTQAGTVVRAILMDGNFSLVDTSFRHVVSEDDLELIWGSAPLYLSLTTAPELPIGDYFVGTQQLGTTGQLNVTVGGDAPIGRSVLMEGTSFTLNYLYSTPRVRLHLGELAVGIPHPNVPLLGGMSMHPVPARDRTHLQFEQIRTGPVNVLVHDQAGRAVKHMAVGDLPPGEHRLTLMVEDLQPGWYMVTLTTPTGPRTGKLIVAH